MKKKLISYIFVVILIIVTIYIIFSSEELGDLRKLMDTTNKLYLILGCMSMLGYWIFDASIINNITKTIHKKLGIVKSLKITMIGQYYSAITPFSSGGQPAQVYSMVNDSMSIAKATLVMMNKFVIYQMVATIYSLMLFILKMRFVYKNIKTALPLVIFGITLNLLGLVILIILFAKPIVLKKIIDRVLRFLYKIKVIKELDKYQAKLEQSVEEYISSIEEIKKNKLKSIKIIIMTIIQLTFNFSITYFIYLSLGFDKASYLEILSVQSLLYMAVCFMPTPGSMGASEGGFYILFKAFFTKNFVMYALLLWRAISYYSRIIICGFVTLLDFLIRKRKKVVAS